MSVFVLRPHVLITVVLKYCLKSEIVMLLPLFFSLRIALAFGHLYFAYKFRVMQRVMHN